MGCRSWMGTVSSTKGFTISEMLIGLLFLSVMLSVSLRPRVDLNLEHYYFLNDYVLTQSEAIKEKQYRPYEQGIYFNSMGHIDLARTVEFGNHRFTLNLGNGYVLIK